ncbi:MAG: oligoendopeptidase F [Oscillospiraceae bacterium]|nr:oligoendopeptidase F [Oscillospiraceae bacterium]
MENEHRIPKRSEVPVEDTWAIEDLYPTDDAWEEDLLRLQAAQSALAAYSGQLAVDGKMLFAYLQHSEQTNVLAERLAAYAMRQSDVDTRNAHYQEMVGRLMNIAVSLDAACSFETPEIMAISEERLQEFYAGTPELERYRRYITDLRRRKAHILSAQEEKLLAAAGEMSQTPSNVFGAFSNADLTFPDAVDAQEKALPLSQSTFITYQESPDRVLRKSAYENLYRTYGGFKNTAAAVINAQMKQLQFFADARKYGSALEASLDLNNVPVSVYYNLIDAVHQNMDKMHRYVRLRKRMLGVDELHFYDVYTQLVQGVDKKIPFASAKETVYHALAPLGDAYRTILKEGFDSRWIDIYENEGKRAGAYSCGVAVHPYVMLNYTGTLDSQFTLAHEMGHALHSYLSNQTQNPVDAGYVIFVAEVASTCNEALLMQYLLSKTTDRQERMYLLNHFLEQFKGTVYRQTMFAEFEMLMGKLVSEGKTLTAEVLCSEYSRLNAEYFGEEMVLDEHIAMEWARIPHFYFNYYVFQYATGFSAAIALSRRILKEGEPAVHDYLEFLSGGCSKSPIELLKGAGVDMTGPEPVNQALALFGELLDEMEALLEA